MKRVFIPPTLSELVPVAATAPLVSLSGLTMGTSWSVKLIGPLAAPLSAITNGIQQQLELVVAQMSTWREDSDLSRYNRAAAGSWQVLPAQFLSVLDGALHVARLSDGAYDPSIGALVNLWGFGPIMQTTPAASTSLFKPTTAAWEQARQRCGWQRLRIDRARSSVLQPGGLYLDFSAIAKGFGVDLVAAYLHSIGVVSYLVEVGGELRGHGIKPDGQPWWVGLEEPPSEQADGKQQAHQTLPSIVALHAMALATSGDYRRFFEQDGRRYSHTIDARTGQPIAHGLAAVTVLHPDCMMADAWATALMVLGVEDGMRLAQRLELAALFLRRAQDGRGLQENISPALQAMLA